MFFEIALAQIQNQQKHAGDDGIHPQQLEAVQGAQKQLARSRHGRPAEDGYGSIKIRFFHTVILPFDRPTPSVPDGTLHQTVLP